MNYDTEIKENRAMWGSKSERSSKSHFVGNYYCLKSLPNFDKLTDWN